jgi:hypothetical protein
MLTWRTGLIVILQATLFTTCTKAYAQSITGAGQWVDDLFLVDSRDEFPFPKVMLDNENLIAKTIPSIAKAIDFPVPLSQRQLFMRSLWHNDALFTVAFGGRDSYETTEDGITFKRCTFGKWHDEKWHYLGYYKTPPKMQLIAIPCDNERFITISAHLDLTGNNNPLSRSPFSRMSIVPGKEELRLDTQIDHNIDDIRKHMSDPICFNLAIDSQIVMTDKYAILVSCTTGLYWIFSLEKAALKYSGKIFKKVTTDMMAKGGFPKAILGAEPEKDGTVLISAQEEVAFITETGDAVKEINDLMAENPNMSPADLQKVYQDRKKELARLNPLLAWYKIDPENGKVEKLSLFPIGAASLRTTGDEWRPMPDGSVRMGPVIPKSSSTPASKKLPDDDKR